MPIPEFGRQLSDIRDKVVFPKETVIGALADYISTPNENFQPMNANFGILPQLEDRIRNKQERYEKLANISLNKIQDLINM